MPSLPTRIVRKIFRPLYRPYYRLLWRRRFPGARALERWVRRWETSSSRADVPLTAPSWDEAYAAGFWDFLAGADEATRYGMIAGLARRLAPGGAVLDVGCGDGVLRHHLDPATEYHGIDLSAEAIRRAEARATDLPYPGSTRFEVADAERWQPSRSYPAIVFNECLYYLERPLAAAHRYLDALSPDGAMIVSMFRGPRSRAIAHRLRRELPPSEELELHHPAKGRWTLLVFISPTDTS